MALLESLLEWCPLLMVLDGAYERVLRLGLKIDVVIGDFDSIKTEERLADIEYVKIDEQETTDLEKGIDWLKEHEFTEINVVWASGKRLDHTFNNISLLAKYANLNLVFYDDHSKAYRISSGFKKHFNKGDILSLLPLGRVEGINTVNLKYPLKKEALELGVRSGSSNEVLEDGVVEIQYVKGDLVLIESRDAH